MTLILRILFLLTLCFVVISPRSARALDQYTLELSAAQDLTSDTSDVPNYTRRHHRQSVGLELVSGLLLGSAGSAALFGLGLGVGLTFDCLGDDCIMFPLVSGIVAVELFGPFAVAGSIDLVGNLRKDEGRFWFAYLGAELGMLTANSCLMVTSETQKESQGGAIACLALTPVLQAGLGTLLYNVSPSDNHIENKHVVLPHVSLLDRGAMVGLNARF